MNRRQREYIIFFLLSAACVLINNGCEESLPPLEQTPELFRASTIVSYDYFYSRDPRAVRNQIKYIFVVKNIYDETIEDTLDFSGNITLTWVESNVSGTQSSSKTVELTKSLIKYMQGYNSSTGVLTLDPQDSLVIEYNWEFIADDSTNLLETFPSYRLGGEDGCTRTYAQTIRASGNIHLMKFRGNILIKPFDFRYCFFAADGTPPCADYKWYPCN